jgi:hypothetical protein
VVVYAEAVEVDSTDRAILPAADAFTLAIAERARTLLGARGDTLPRGEPAITWRRLPTTLIVTAHRDGRITWRTPVAIPDTATEPLLARAASVAIADGEKLFWPERYPADSATFRVRLRWPSVNRDGKVERLRVRAATPLFTLAVPWEEGVRTIRQPAVAYPEELIRAGVTGYVILEFIVDTAGRAVPRTIRDVWPASQPPLRADLRGYYTSFVAAARRSVERARFEPARVGGCPVFQLVELPFEFKFRP